MRKLLLLSIVVAGLFAQRYPIIMEYYYMSSCVNAAKKDKDKMADYCACTLNEIEKNYTLSEFLNNMQTDKDNFLKEVMKKAVPKCIDKLAK